MQSIRLESMSPAGFLRLFRQDDGDIIVVVGEGDPDGNIVSTSSVEFCTPITGGGGSSRTHRALIDLLVAMAEDNMDKYQDGRKPLFIDDKREQEAIVKWGEELKQVRKEFGDDI